MDDHKVIEFTKKPRNLTKEDIFYLLSIGYMHINLYKSIDNDNVFFTLSYELEPGLSNDYIEVITKILNDNFQEIFSTIFKLYKSTE